MNISLRPTESQKSESLTKVFVTRQSITFISFLAKMSSFPGTLVDVVILLSSMVLDWAESESRNSSSGRVGVITNFKSEKVSYKISIG